VWWLVPIVGLILGVYFGGFLNFTVPAGVVKYLSIGILASLDSVFGGIKALYEKKYDNLLMLSGFFANALLAAALTYIGDMLGIDLYYAAIFAFGVRLFGNLSMIRVHIITNMRERERILREYDREREESESAAASAAVGVAAATTVDADAADAAIASADTAAAIIASADTAAAIIAVAADAIATDANDAAIAATVTDALTAPAVAAAGAVTTAATTAAAATAAADEIMNDPREQAGKSNEYDYVRIYDRDEVNL